MRFAIVCIASICCSGAFAISPVPPIINSVGVVDDLTLKTLTIRDDKGTALKFDMTLKPIVLRGRRISPAEVKADDVVVAIAVRTQDGTLHSDYLSVYRDAVLAQKAVDEERKRTMFSVTFGAGAILAGNNHVKVKSPDGESDLILDPGLRVTRMEETGRDSLQPGQKVHVQGLGNSATRVTIQ